MEIKRSAHMRKLHLAAERFFSVWAVIRGPALLSRQTGNGLSCGRLRSQVCRTATLQANRPPLLPGKLRGPWKVARLEIIRLAHMRKLQLAADRFFSGLAALRGPALLSGQTGNGLSCGGLRSWLV